MRASPRDWGILAALALAGWAVMLALPALTANLHFVVDDWEQLQLPYYNDLLSSVIGAVGRRLRVGREVFLALEVKLLGLDRHAMQIVSVTFHAVNAALFGACLLLAFPHRPVLALAGLSLGISFPTLLASTYFAIESTRLPLSLTFVSVLCLQAWARRPRTGWLAAAAVTYFASLTVYENAILFVAVMPFFALPVLRDRDEARLESGVAHGMLRIGLALAAAGVAFLVYRYALGFRDDARAPQGFPPPSFVLDSLETAARYVVSPILSFQGDGAALAAGGAWATATLAALLAASETVRRRGRTPAATGIGLERGWYTAALGLAMLVFGLVPYLLVGVGGGELKWTTAPRILSSAAYGIVLLAATVVAWAPERRPAVTARVAAATLAGAWLAFGFGLRSDWQEAADRHCRMWRSQLEQVPYVADGTVFLVDGLREASGRAIVFAGSDSLLALTKMLYKWPGVADRVYAYHLERARDGGTKPIVVTPDGVTTPLSPYHVGGPFAPDALILLRRDGERIDVVDAIAAASSPYAIDWRGVDRLATNRARILPPPPGAPSARERLARLSIRCGD